MQPYSLNFKGLLKKYREYKTFLFVKIHYTQACMSLAPPIFFLHNAFYFPNITCSTKIKSSFLLTSLTEIFQFSKQIGQ